MARESMRDKISRLEEENKQLREDIEKDFVGTKYYESIQRNLKRLKTENDSQQRTIERLNEKIEKLQNKEIEPKKQDRGKETQKAKIERLERENAELKTQLHDSWKHEDEQIQLVHKLKNEQNNSFENSSLYKEMVQKIKFLENEVISKQKHIEDLTKIRDNQAIMLSEQERKIVHNERGAGRKQKLTPVQKEEVLIMYQNGESMRSIAQHMKCSASLVCKLINEQKKD